jgi:CspA family cold shock protein
MVPAPSGRSRNRLWADKTDLKELFNPGGRNIMTTGTVTRLVEDRGFGFIGNNSGKDVFFHYTQLDGIKFQTLKEGQYVCYRVGLGAKGFEAKDIKLYKATV